MMEKACDGLGISLLPNLAGADGRAKSLRATTCVEDGGHLAEGPIRYGLWAMQRSGLDS